MSQIKQIFRPKYRVDECMEAIRGVLESGWTGQGPNCQAFEKEFQAFLGTSAQQDAVFCNSATAALHMAVKLCDLPPGSKIATTALTFCSTNHVILYENHTPVFCDINMIDLSLSAESVIQAIKAGARAVIWVHLGGNVTSGFYTVCDYIKNHAPDVVMIEDCAHAAGSFYQGYIAADGHTIRLLKRRVGSPIDGIKQMSCFSFQAVKNLPTADSGMLVIPSEYSVRARKLVWLGIDKSTYSRTNTQEYKWRYTIDELGYKYNGNDIMAAIARVQLKYLDHDNAYRKMLYKTYQEALIDRPLLHAPESSQHLIQVLVRNREEVMQQMQAAGYGTGVHYLPNYEFPIFAPYYQAGSCPITEEFAPQILSLPNHSEVTIEDVLKICEIINQNYFSSRSLQ